MKLVKTLIFPLLVALSGTAQTTLPYSTGFDNPSEKAGWQLFKIGDAAPPVPQEWAYSGNAPYSPAECIYHGYPVGGSQVTDNWFVSPGFSIPEGGKLDSVYAAFSGFGLPAPDDTVAIYLLVGSPDPEQASSRILLVDYRGALYNSDNQWRAVRNIPLPAQTQNSYLAIRYRTVVNWLDVKFDDIAISSNSSTSIRNKQSISNVFIYPNPVASDVLNIQTDAQFDWFVVHNLLGQKVQAGSFKTKLDVSMLPAGNYILNLGGAKGLESSYPFIKE